MKSLSRLRERDSFEQSEKQGEGPVSQDEPRSALSSLPQALTLSLSKGEGAWRRPWCEALFLRQAQDEGCERFTARRELTVLAKPLAARLIAPMVKAMKRTFAALLTAAALTACVTAVPEEQVDAAGVRRLCAQLASEPGLLQRGALGHRILDAGAEPTVACRDAAYDAALASDHYRLVDAYQTVRLAQ